MLKFCANRCSMACSEGEVIYSGVAAVGRKKRAYLAILF